MPYDHRNRIFRLMLMDGKPENSEGIIPIAVLGEFVFGKITAEETYGETRCYDVRAYERRAGQDYSII